MTQYLNLMVGLGNPGVQYKYNRHNIGFLLIDQIAEVFKFEKWNYNEKFQAYVSVGVLEGNKIFLLKPQTYMNLSGKSVIKFCRFYKISQQNMIVIHDDIDLELSRIKIKIGGSHGGHNGLKSIDELVGKDYYRLRYGVSRPSGLIDVADYVLQNFSNDEMRKNNLIISVILDNMLFLTQGLYDKFITNVKNNIRLL